MKKVLVVIFSLFIISSFSQSEGGREMLLTNMKVQMECTEAIDSLYNFNFEAAEKQFRWMRQSYPNHPLPYFLMALSNWWKIVPDDDNTAFDDVFFDYLDSTITIAEDLLDQDQSNPEPAFFLAAAYGFKARRQADNGDYVSSAFTAKKSLEYMHIETKDEMFSPEFLFGEGLYNYYRDYLWKSGSYKYLKHLLMLFKEGDEAKGLEQLHRVSREAFYSRIEAKYHLMEIYGYHSKEDDRLNKAFALASELADSYPNNSYFNMVAAEMAYRIWNRPAMLKYATVVVKGYAENKFGYSSEETRKCAYVLSHYYPPNSDENVKALKLMVACAEEANSLERCYTIRAAYKLARYYETKNDVEETLKYCYLITENSSESDCWQSAKERNKRKKKNLTRKEWRSQKDEIKADNEKHGERDPHIWAENFIDEHTDKSWYEFW